MIIYDEVVCIKKDSDMNITIGTKYTILLLEYPSNFNSNIKFRDYIRIKDDNGDFNIFPEVYFMEIKDYRDMLIEEMLEE